MPTSEQPLEAGEQKATGRRVVGIDLLRICAGTTVIFVHVYGQPANHQWFYPWNLAIFLVLCGYFWRPGRRFVDELRKRGRTLAMPYLVWLIVIVVVVTTVPTRAGRYPVRGIVDALIGGSHAVGPFGTLWFVSALFFTCLLYRLLDRIPWVGQVIIAIAAIAVAYLFGPVLATTPLAIGQAVPLLAFLIAGRGVAKLVPLVRYPLITGAGMLVVSAATIAFVPLTPFDLKSGHWGTPVIEPILSVVICAALILIAGRIALPARIASLASLLATAAIAVVLGHLVVVTEGRDDLIRSSIILVVAVVVSWVGAAILRISPLSLPFTGWRRFRPGIGVRTAVPEALRRAPSSSPQPASPAVEQSH
ncbi:MAG TPA: acyltransferase family protein [Galbitalea sp.]|jgi:surface polysaccharide O-acyltransferase-like enzyme|nr:acyltransferase family protein [Galbitalea sp.]